MPAPTLTLDQLTTPVTRQEVEASIYNVLAILGVNTTSWKPGAVVRTMIVAASIILAAFSDLQAKIARSGFLELSSGDWLELVAYYVYGVTKIKATFATGEVTLTNGGGGVFTLDPDDLIITNSTTGKTYRNTAGFTLGALGEVTVAIQAVEAGAASTSAPGAIDALETVLLNVTVTNALAVVGRDAESDAGLRTRCYEKLGALSPMGPWDAYASAVRNAVREDGTSLGITRLKTLKDGYGHVDTYLATATGTVPGTVGDLDTDLGIADEAIQQYAEPLAVTARTFNATVVTIAITYEVWLYNTSGLTDLQVQDLIATRLTTYLSTQPIGGNVVSGVGKIYLDALRAVISASLPEIFHVVITVPGGDTTLAATEVPVIAPANPVCTAVHQVPPPEGFGS
jgi:hypothetical protein